MIGPTTTTIFAVDNGLDRYGWFSPGKTVSDAPTERGNPFSLDDAIYLHIFCILVASLTVIPARTFGTQGHEACELGLKFIAFLALMPTWTTEHDLLPASRDFL